MAASKIQGNAVFTVIRINKFRPRVYGNSPHVTNYYMRVLRIKVVVFFSFRVKYKTLFKFCTVSGTFAPKIGGQFRASFLHIPANFTFTYSRRFFTNYLSGLEHGRTIENTDAGGQQNRRGDCATPIKKTACVYMSPGNG